MKQAQDGAGALAPLAQGVACDEGAQADEQRRNACLSQADLMWSQSDLAGAEGILMGLAGSFSCMSLGDARLETVQRLMFVRALRERPGQPALNEAVCAVANQIAPRRPTAASALAMPTIRATLDQNRYDQGIADLTAHIARRWIRENQDLFAWYFMEALSQSLGKAAAPPGQLTPRSAMDGARQQKLAQSLIALDRAYLAERSGWAAAGEIEHARALADAQAIELQDIERLREELAKYWQRSYGFTTPTPAAAAEFTPVPRAVFPRGTSAGVRRSSSGLGSSTSIARTKRAPRASRSS